MSLYYKKQQQQPRDLLRSPSTTTTPSPSRTTTPLVYIPDMYADMHESAPGKGTIKKMALNMINHAVAAGVCIPKQRRRRSVIIIFSAFSALFRLDF